MSALKRRSTEALMRSAMLLLAAGGVLVTTIELAGARHWDATVQLVPWAALVVVAVAVAAVAIRPNRRRLTLARAAAALVAAAALYGIVMHVKANYDAGPLDAEYGPRWQSAATTTRLWWAFSETVGPSPVLAPLVLAQIAILTVIATLRHPNASSPPRAPAQA